MYEIRANKPRAAGDQQLWHRRILLKRVYVRLQRPVDIGRNLSSAASARAASAVLRLYIRTEMRFLPDSTPSTAGRSRWSGRNAPLEVASRACRYRTTHSLDRGAQHAGCVDPNTSGSHRLFPTRRVLMALA